MWRRLSPAQSILAFFILSILAGSFLLSLPVANVSREGLSIAGYITNLFTATSAVCVTGLAVVDTGTHFTLFGQIVILILIQIGALGYVTFVTLAGMLLGKLPIKERLAIKEVVDPSTFEGLLTLLKHIIKITIAVEAAGAVMLALFFSRYFSPVKSIYYGIFHSISAFSNAGFSIFPNSFESFGSDIPIMLIISALIVAGGIGFLVIKDILNYRKRKNISLHSKMAIVITFVLIFLGAALFFFLEYKNPHTLEGKPLAQKFLDSVFQSITSRTAGFNSIPIGAIGHLTAFFIMILMFIGASPGGTGGGIKTTTFGVIILWVLSYIRGKPDVNVFSRKISQETISKAVIFVMLGIVMITTMFFLLFLSQEKPDFIDSIFEVFSAYGTVGLSRGITPKLSVEGRVILIVTMLVGRIGPITLLMSAVGKKEKYLIQYSEEKVLIG